MRVITFGWFCKLFKAKELSGYPCNQLNFLNDIIEEIIIFGDNSTYIKRVRSEATANRIFNSKKDISDNYSNAITISNVEEEIARLAGGFIEVITSNSNYDIDLRGFYDEAKEQIKGVNSFRKALGVERYESLIDKESEYFLAELLIYLIKLIPNNKEYIQEVQKLPDSVYDKNGMYEVQHRALNMLKDYIILSDYQQIIELGIHRELSNPVNVNRQLVFTVDNLFPYLNGFVGLYLVSPDKLTFNETFSSLEADFATNWSIPLVGLLNFNENIFDLKFIYESFVVNGDTIMEQNVEPLERFFINERQGEIMYAFGWFDDFRKTYKFLDRIMEMGAHMVYMTVEMPNGIINYEKFVFTKLAVEFWERYNSFNRESGECKQKIILDGRGNRFIRSGFMIHLLIDYTPVLDIAGSDNYKKVLTKYMSHASYIDKYE
ncbi:hypothetical protein [Streptococcus salivarius]|uniref:hypothetical protein n=1 Tax=Streptococcus salivarius TaxID=1304 RepID=UPI0034A2586A